MHKVKKFALPKRVKTAYQLLSYVGELFKKEPKRVAMGTLLQQPCLFTGGDTVITLPPCNTVGCIAGWINAHYEPRAYGYDVAMHVLDISYDEAKKLFEPRLLHARDQQCKAHAAKVLKHIAKFQKRYGKRLKDRIIPRRLSSDVKSGLSLAPSR